MRVRDVIKLEKLKTKRLLIIYYVLLMGTKRSQTERIKKCVLVQDWCAYISDLKVDKTSTDQNSLFDNNAELNVVTLCLCE
jgi:hypothetical protein